MRLQRTKIIGHTNIVRRKPEMNFWKQLNGYCDERIDVVNRLQSYYSTRHEYVRSVMHLFSITYQGFKTKTNKQTNKKTI